MRDSVRAVLYRKAILFTLALLAPALVAARSAPTPSSKDRAVSAYFAALDREDYMGALSRTTGQAYELTAHIVGELQSQAQKRHVRLDLATRRVEIAAPSDGPVLVRFDIDVHGRFAFFRKKVRSVHGEATFSVDDNGQISTIRGDLLGL